MELKDTFKLHEVNEYLAKELVESGVGSLSSLNEKVTVHVFLLQNLEKFL